MAEQRTRRRGLLIGLLGVIGSVLAVASPASAQVVRCQGEVATIVGTRGNDRLVGTSGKDVIVGLGGADVIIGRGGPDVICGGWGDDVINAGAGNDRVYAGYGNDQIAGGPHADILFGGPGRDVITGNSGFDTVNGGPGKDSVMGGKGNDKVSGGLGPDRVVGGAGVDELDGGAGRDVCGYDDVHIRCESPTAATRPPDTPAIEVERVIHISIDGLRADHITPWLTPTLSSMQRDGVSTMNARTDPEFTNTLPNHTAQFTGRAVLGPAGHGVTVNSDDGETVHEKAGEYVASVFDVAHDHGLITAMYVGKSKFDLINRSWNEKFGATDTVGTNDGRDKIDVYLKDDPAAAVETFLKDLDRTDLGRDDAYIFFHIRLPDSAGHEAGWGSKPYADAVEESDAIVKQIVDHIAANPLWATSTGFVVTADHGGPLGGKSHHSGDDANTYSIPFIVSAPGVAAGSDLYTLNAGTRRNPGTDHVDAGGVQPIRGHEAGNVSLDLLGLPAIPGSTFNARQDLELD